MKATVRKAVMLDDNERVAINRARAALGKAKPAPSAQSIADETAARLRNAAQRGDPSARVRNMPAGDLHQFIGERREITLESLAYPALTGQRRGTPASGPQSSLDEKAARAQRIARIAIEHADPVVRAEHAEWARNYIRELDKTAALAAAGKFLATSEQVERSAAAGRAANDRREREELLQKLTRIHGSRIAAEVALHETQQSVRKMAARS